MSLSLSPASSSGVRSPLGQRSVEASSSSSSSSASASPFAAAQSSAPHKAALNTTEIVDLKIKDLMSRCDTLSSQEKSKLILEIKKNYYPSPLFSNPISRLLNARLADFKKNQALYNDDQIEDVWNDVKEYMQPKNSHRLLYRHINEACEKKAPKLLKDNPMSVLSASASGVAVTMSPEMTSLMTQIDTLPLGEKFIILYEINTVNDKYSDAESQNFKNNNQQIIGKNYKYSTALDASINVGWEHLKNFLKEDNVNCKLYKNIHSILLKRVEPESVSTQLGTDIIADPLGAAVFAGTIIGPITMLPEAACWVIDKTTRSPISVVELYKVVNKIEALKQSNLNVVQLKNMVKDILEKYKSVQSTISTSKASRFLVTDLSAGLAQAQRATAENQNEKNSVVLSILTQYLTEKRWEPSDDESLDSYLAKPSMVLRAHKNNGKKLFLAICNVINNFTLPEAPQEDESVAH